MELRNVKLEAMIIFEGSTALKAEDTVRRKPISSPVPAKSKSPQASSEGSNTQRADGKEYTSGGNYSSKDTVRTKM